MSNLVLRRDEDIYVYICQFCNRGARRIYVFIYVYVCMSRGLHISYLIARWWVWKGICMSAYFLLVCVSIVSMLLDVLALYVGDLQVEVFPITVSSKPGGGRRRTWEASVKVRRYRCIAIDSKASRILWWCIRMWCMRGYVMCYEYIYIYIQSDVVEYRPGMSTWD